MRVPIYHNNGYHPCGKLAGYYIGPFGMGIKLNAYDIELLDGTNQKSDEVLRCDNCKEVLYLTKVCFEQFTEENI